jgi:hypothetical protein
LKALAQGDHNWRKVKQGWRHWRKETMFYDTKKNQKKYDNFDIKYQNDYIK